MLCPQLIRRIGVACLFAVCGHPAMAQSLPQPPDKGIIWQEKFEKTPKYQKKWALVVGIDYKREPGQPSDGGSVDELRNAEKDATAVAELLKSYYGYSDEEIVLLIGKDATNDAIEKMLTEGFLCNQKVGSEDSVLFYFSGHGWLSKLPDGKDDKGYLLPFDVEVDQKGRPITGRAVDIRSRAEHLKKHCPARHKLFILDCCYSGAIFLEGFSSSGKEYTSYHGSLFQERAFQVITAGRASQPVSDGSDGHSPFTHALLRSLTFVPLRIDRDPYCFTTNLLFRQIRSFMTGKDQAGKQLPMCQWLDGNQGEFHFFPDPEKEFPRDGLDTKKARAMLLAMVPTAFGNWWVNEAPWFLPGLRHEILLQKPESRNLEGDFNLAILRKEARDLRSRLGSDTSEVLKRRLKFMDSLLNAETSMAVEQVMNDIVKELKLHQESLDAPDLHYLAVLQHKLTMKEEAEESYEKALEEYKQKRDTHPEYRYLEALCKSDYGYYQLDCKGQFEKAAGLFSQARQAFALDAPAPFRVFTLSREAAAWRKNGNWGLAEERTLEALNQLKVFDPDETHLLSAATWKQHAWGCMDQWQFSQAWEAFHRSANILSKKPPEDRFESWIDYFHVEHGLAVVPRYQGNALEALKRYRKLTREIANKIRELDGTREPMENYAQIRALLYQRLVNGLERQGDCNLFSDRPDYLEAADDYRRALHACNFVSEDLISSLKASLLYKQAIALLLDKRSRALGVGTNIRHAADDNKAQYHKCPPSVLDFYASLAEALDVNQTVDDPEAGLKTIRDAVKEFRNAHQSRVRRDDLEGLMFAGKILLERERELFKQELLKDRFQLDEDANMLLEFCRLAHRTPSPDPFTLNFLRPYYDSVFAAKVAVNPPHAKELIEVAWEATRGTPYEKLENLSPVLVVHCVHDQCYALLDVPFGVSECHVLDREVTLQALRNAYEKSEALTLPDQVRTTLRGLQSLIVRWHDPVLRLGYPEDNVGNGVMVVAEKTTSATDEVVLAPKSEKNCPFDIRLAVDGTVTLEPGPTFVRKSRVLLARP